MGESEAQEIERLREECLGWHNRVDQLETAIDQALRRLVQRQVLLNEQLPEAAEAVLTAGEAILVRCLPQEKRS
jgi:hypothetical protein